MSARKIVPLAAAAAALFAAAPAVAHVAPSEGLCTSVEMVDRDVTMQVTGPADVEAWIKQEGVWSHVGVNFNGEFAPSGYKWVADAATMTTTLPPGEVEFQLDVWTTAGLDDTCYVAVPEKEAPVTPTPAPPPPAEEAPAQVIPAVSPPVKPPPARVGIRKTGPKRVRAGDRAFYKIRVTNTANRRVRFTLIDRLPRDVVLLTRRRGWVVRGRGVRIPMVLKAKQTRTMRLPVRVLRTAKGRRCNVAVVRGPEIVNRRTQTCARVTRRVGRVLPAVTG
jgi:hypothetical protein